MANERYAEFTEETPKSFVQGLFEESATQRHRLGTIRKLSDGREFIYVKVGAANVAAGRLVQSEAANMALSGNLAVTANANVGDRSVSVTIGNTTLANTANALAEGYVWESTANVANAAMYKIKSHAAIAANGTGTLCLYDKIRVALTTSSKVSLYKHKCKDVIIHPSPPTSALVGVTTFPLTANYYAFVQKRGECTCFLDTAALVPGDCVIASPSVDGAVLSVAANGGFETERPVGIGMANSAANNAGLIDLML